MYSRSNVLVHLRPAPIVARVMTGTVALHGDPRRWLEREVSVLEFLLPSGLAVSPSRLIAPGPHCHDGLWMTFTEWVPEVEPRPDVHIAVSVDDARELGRMLRYLHDALRPYDRALGGLRELREDIERLLGQLRLADGRQRAAISSLGERLNALESAVFESRLPTQALHGDVSLRNLLRTPRRLVWNDFEDTFRGPVHWDVASAVGSLASAERTRAASARCSTPTAGTMSETLRPSSPLKTSMTRFGECMTGSDAVAGALQPPERAHSRERKFRNSPSARDGRGGAVLTVPRARRVAPRVRGEVRSGPARPVCRSGHSGSLGRCCPRSRCGG